MRVALLTREFPPEVYGGAGVHVEHLAAELARLVEVDVHCFGAPRPSGLVAAAYQPWDALAGPDPSAAALRAMSVDLAMAAGTGGADVVHSHTWYANLAGHLSKLLHGVPHVITSHSVEPLRPWKRDQLGPGYALSLFCEKTGLEGADAVIAVSEATAADLRRAYPSLDPRRIEVIHNGVDTSSYQPVADSGAMARIGVDPGRPFVVFVGRLTRQKGIFHLLDAAAHFEPGTQVVLCASDPDVAADAEEMGRRVASLQARRDGVFWIDRHLPRTDVVQLLSHATAFVCPSVYEPFGLVNVEAMACGAAVVASRTGGIPEIVVDGETGWLVPLGDTGPDGSPIDAAAFARGLAEAVNRLVGDPATARRFGDAGRQRVIERFSWPAVARQTVALYERVSAG